MEAKMDAKLAEFEGRIPTTSSNGEFQNNFRQSHSFRHTAPNVYGGAPSGQFPPSSSGQDPTNYGANPGTYHPSTFVINYGANGNFYPIPGQNPGCFKCGDLTHWKRECPLFQAEQQGPFPQPPQPNPSQPPSSLQPPQPHPQPDLRPLKDRSSLPDKTCIWVRYSQYKLSALIDTDSDVSIASEEIANNMGWKIHAHRTKEVCVANNDIMTISGAAQLTLRVGGRPVDSEILISPSFEGLILGYDWITQQGKLDWDMPRDLMQTGTGNCMKVHYGEPFVKVRRIFTTKDVTIPARGQVNVNARIMHNA